jgi:hypothetical protein
MIIESRSLAIPDDRPEIELTLQLSRKEASALMWALSDGVKSPYSLVARVSLSIRNTLYKYDVRSAHGE